MIDHHGYRLNVGMIICNENEQVILAKKINCYLWQFPQGGINPGESLEQAMYRELFEEIGLIYKDVIILSSTCSWLYYKFPEYLICRDTKPLCIGQKQKWFLLKLICKDININMQNSSKPEFDDWRWVSYWYPIRQIVPFKRNIYRKVMKKFSKYLS